MHFAMAITPKIDAAVVTIAFVGEITPNCSSIRLGILQILSKIFYAVRLPNVPYK